MSVWMFLVLTIPMVLALLPAVMVIRNLTLFLPPESDWDSLSVCVEPAVSVLIPARNEAEGIAETIHAALQNQRVAIEVIVLDDSSTDATPDIVDAISQRDSRVRLIRGGQLPSGWNGKQYACFQLASASQHEEMVFIDADVRLNVDGLRRLLDTRRRNGCDLLSVFPYQVTLTFWERLLIPMMHYLLLGYLPLDRMRNTVDPAFAAGCGQLFLTTKSSYAVAGTHQTISGSRHDGIKLPRAYRSRGLRTDVLDGTPIATCRMYGSGGEVFRGLLKNAYEGIANPKLIGLFTVLLIGGSVAPLVSMLFVVSAADQLSSSQLLVGLCSVLLAFLPRVLCAKRFRQSYLGVLMHPVAVIVFVILQWVALYNHLRGHQVAWRGRTES